jgi:peptide deformylase
MALLKIARMGHPVLRMPAMPVPDPTDLAVQELAADMLETLREAPGVGLAAPQVYVPLRMIVLRIDAERSGGEAVPETVLVNPAFQPLDDETALGLEGCLSVPGLCGLVPRFIRIGYSGWGPDGQWIEGQAEGFAARVIQHEMDHLDGRLYIDRMTDLRQLAFVDEARHLVDDAADS